MIDSGECPVQCPICMEPYSLDFKNPPRIVGSCGHTICTNCLLEITKQPEKTKDPKPKRCPIDNKIELQYCNRSDVEKFYAKNYSLMEALQEMEAKARSNSNPDQSLLSVFPDNNNDSHQTNRLIISSKFDLENYSNLCTVFREKISKENLSLTRVCSFNQVRFEVLLKVFTEKMVKDANIVFSKIQRGSIKSFELNLLGCHLKTDNTIYDITHQMSQMTSLQDLTMNFSCTPVKFNYFQNLRENLSNSLGRIVSLKLLLNRSSIGIKVFQIFAEEISAKLISIKKLMLCLFNAEITEFDVVWLSEAIKNLKTLNSFKLILSSNLKVNNISCLVDGLNKLTNLKSLKLNLVRTNITDESLENFSELAHFAGLSNFDVNLSSNRIGDRSLKALSSLTKKMTKLKKFKLSLFRTEITDFGLMEICNSLKDIAKNLTNFYIFLGFTRIWDDGISSLAKTIGRMSQLKRLVMKLRKVRANKFNLLFREFSNLRTLEYLELWLNDTKISDKSLETFKVNQLKALKRFNLNLRHTNITDDSVCKLCKTITELPFAQNMESFFLNLSHTKTRDKGLKSLWELLKTFKNLQNLSLSLCRIQIRKRFADSLFDAMKTFWENLRLLELNLANTTVFDPDIEKLVRLLNSNHRLEELILELHTTPITAPSIGKLLSAANRSKSLRFWDIK